MSDARFTRRIPKRWSILEYKGPRRKRIISSYALRRKGELVAWVEKNKQVWEDVNGWRWGAPQRPLSDAIYTLEEAKGQAMEHVLDLETQLSKHQPSGW